MSRYCLDTVAYSDFKRGNPRVPALLDSAEAILVPAAALGEIFAGFERGRDKRKNLAELDEFLAHPVVEVIECGRAIAEIFGEIAADLRRRGRPIPTNDIWIAAACRCAKATLLTRDRHFRAIPSLDVLFLE